MAYLSLLFECIVGYLQPTPFCTVLKDLCHFSIEMHLALEVILT